MEPNCNFHACPKRKATKQRSNKSGYRNSESSEISNDREVRRQISQSYGNKKYLQVIRYNIYTNNLKWRPN